MKFFERICTTKGHGSFLFFIDTELRKYGYRSGLETLVVHTVNYECLSNFFVGLSLHKTFRLGKSCKTGDLMRLAGVCINGGACGLIRQYSGNLTNRRLFSTQIFIFCSETKCIGAAWLSSVRVLRCNIDLFNEHNPQLLV